MKIIHPVSNLERYYVRNINLAPGKEAPIMSLIEGFGDAGKVRGHGREKCNRLVTARNANSHYYRFRLMTVRTTLAESRVYFCEHSGLRLLNRDGMVRYSVFVYGVVGCVCDRCCEEMLGDAAHQLYCGGYIPANNADKR